MRLIAAIALAVGAVVSSPLVAAAETTIVVTPSTIELGLGERVAIDVTVTNTGDSDIAGVVAHIDITDLAEGGSVDPEDWSATLSRSLGAIGAGESRTVTWDVQPISPGTFTLYAVALRGDADQISVSDAVTVTVANRRSLNPEGVLPVAVGAPMVVGAGLLARIRRTHRS